MAPSPSVAEAEHRRELEAAFLRARQSGRRRLVLLRAALNLCGVGLFLLLWESVPLLFPTLNKVLFPTPSVVFRAFWPMVLSGEIPVNIGVSVRRAASGFVLAAIVGIAAGVFTARSLVADYLTEPLLHGFRSVPVIALVPLSVLWFGIGEGAKIALVATGAFFPVWIATFIGVRDVNIIYLRSAACLGAGRIATMFLVVLPAALPLILAGLRQAMAISLIVLVAAELSGATSGVAYMMSMGHQLFRVDIMFIGLMLLGGLGFLFDRLFVWLTRRLFPWYVA